MSHDNGNLAMGHERTNMSDAEGRQIAKKRPVDEENTMNRKKLSDEDEQGAKKKPVSTKKPAVKKPAEGENPAAKRKPAEAGKTAAKKKAAEEENPAAKRKPAEGENPAAKRKPAEAGKTAVKKKAAEEENPAAKRKPAEAGKPAAKKKTVSGKKSVGKKRPVNGKKKPVKRTPANENKRDAAGRRESESEEEFESRMQKRYEERARRREERLRRVRRQKIIMAVSSVIIVASVIVMVIFFMPSMRLSRSLSKGDSCVARAEYAEAQGAYEKALELDEFSVHAYRGLAANYLAQEQTQEAKQIVYTGWEKTQDKSLLDYYCTVVYNEAVMEVNNQNCTLATVDKCIQILEQEADHEDAWKLLGICYERLFKVTEENTTCQMFYDEDAAQDTCSYTEYELLLRRLLALYQANPSEQIKGVLTQYALIDMPYVRISLSHMPQYTALLTEINAVAENARITETLACLVRAQEVTDYFGTAFAEFESGNYAYARDLVAQESYQQIRDSFINENSGCWEGATYIPVNRELLVLHNENDQVKFYFPDSEEYQNRQGIIFVWGSKQEDDGVQRSAISYEPVEEEASGSHTVYKIQYLYSNVKIGNKYEPQMNYRFDTEVTTAEGTTTSAIGDWGGEHEWELDY